MITENETMKIVAAALEAQAITQASIVATLHCINDRVGILNAALGVIVNEIRDGLPVSNPALDRLSQIVEDSATLAANAKKSQAGMKAMADATGELVAMLKAQVGPALSEPPARLGRWVN